MEKDIKSQENKILELKVDNANTKNIAELYENALLIIEEICFLKGEYSDLNVLIDNIHRTVRLTLKAGGWVTQGESNENKK